MLKELGFLRRALAFAVAGAYSLDEARMAIRKGERWMDILTGSARVDPGSVRLQGELWQSRYALLRIPSCLVLKSKQSCLTPTKTR